MEAAESDELDKQENLNSAFITAYERDNETDLDYAKARMYANKLGRFSSPDPLQSSATSLDPQTWNRYSYVSNNPLAFIDPTGMFKWSKALGGDKSDEDLMNDVFKAIADGNDSEANRLAGVLNSRTDVTNSMQNALKAASDGLKNGFLTKKESQRITNAVNSYGKPNDDNGVVVGLDNDTTEGAYTHVEGKTVIVAFNPAQITAANVAHEGVHTKQALDFIATGKGPTLFDTENEAYQVGALTSVGLTDLQAGKVIPYILTANNGAQTKIWGAVAGKSLADVKSNIATNVATHLSNNGINNIKGIGTLPAFPGGKGDWR